MKAKSGSTAEHPLNGSRGRSTRKYPRDAAFLAAALAGSITCGVAFGQGPQPPAAATVSAKAAAPPTSATASASAKASASANPSTSPGALPPGHPPTGEMPPGHPPTGEMPPGHPPTGDLPPGHPSTNTPPENPHGGSGSTAKRSQLFEAPPDTAEDDPSLPVGTIVLSVKDASEQPLANTDVGLGILHNTVAAGESSERRNGTTDAEGNIRWDGLPHGSSTSYRATVLKGVAKFGTDPFAIGDRAGKRVVLHVYTASNDIDDTLIGVQGVVYLALRESSILAQNVFAVYNLGRVAWVPDNTTIALPEGYKTFNRPDSMDGVGIDEVNGKGLLRGTIGPGQHEIEYTFSIPLDQTEKQSITLALPPHVAQMRVMVESTKSMGADVKGFPAPRKTKNRDGKRVLVTEKMVSRESGGLDTIEITLNGLPTAGPGRWISALLGLSAIGAGFAYVASRRGNKTSDEETRRDLVDARDALLREIVSLEKAHRSGEIGPKTYERLRGALLLALERLVTKIADATPKKYAQRAVDAED